jgi:inner membrane transporter RhtA
VAAAVVTIPGVVQGGRHMFRPDLLAVGAAIGILSSVIPYWLELEALRRITAQLFGVWMSLQPAVAALIGLAILSQRLRPAEWLGICCVVAASAGASRAPRRDDGRPTPAATEADAERTAQVNGALAWCACFPVSSPRCCGRRCGRCTAGHWPR